MASDRAQPTVPMDTELKSEIDRLADRYGTSKVQLMRLMLRAGIQDIEHNGFDALADRAERGTQTISAD